MSSQKKQKKQAAKLNSSTLIGSIKIKTANLDTASAKVAKQFMQSLLIAVERQNNN